MSEDIRTYSGSIKKTTQGLKTFIGFSETHNRPLKFIALERGEKEQVLKECDVSTLDGLHVSVQIVTNGADHHIANIVLTNPVNGNSVRFDRKDQGPARPAPHDKAAGHAQCDA